MQRTPRISAVAMYARNKRIIENTPPDKSQSESDRSSGSYSEETSPKKRKINIKESPMKAEPEIVEKKGKEKNAATFVEKENLFHQPTFDTIEPISNENNILPNQQDMVVVKKKRGRKKKILKNAVEAVEKTDENHVLVHDQYVKVKKMKGKQEKEDIIEAVEEDQNENIDFSPSFSNSCENQSVPCGNEAADAAFHWLLNPFKPEYFFEKAFDKNPLLVKRSKSNYYKGLFSTKEFDKILKENDLSYDDHIDVLQYVNGERLQVHNNLKVNSAFVWNKYKEGNSVRMRNPQTYHRALGSLCSLLQEYFSNYVGANMYLTPAGTQGFPPHYDDIDAFILQIEGKKLWKLYKPRENEVLARHSSVDMTEDEIGKPCMEVELNAGDMLYFPRGFIHQAKAASDVHSLHITLSTNQLNTYGDFLQAGLSKALEQAMQNDVEFRKSIPKDYLNFLGCTYADNDSKQRKIFGNKVMELAKKTLNYFSLDYAADMHSIEFIHASMPPFFNKNEKGCSIHGNGPRIVNGQAIVTTKLTLQTNICLIRKRAFRLIMDENGARLYYTLENSQNYKEGDSRFLDVDFDMVPIINALFKSHPKFLKIRDLPHEDFGIKLTLAQDLYDCGFLMTAEPLSYEE